MTAPRLKPSEMPGWPAKMGLHLAAAFVDESPDRFERGVAEGIYPQPVWILGRKYWRLKDLDEAVDRLANPKGTMSKAEALRALGSDGKGQRNAVRHRAA